MPPWSVQELETCFIVIDSAGQKLAFVYFEDEPGRREVASPFARSRSAEAGPSCLDYAALRYAASMCDTPQARHSKV
jgi:hypothetical protein